MLNSNVDPSYVPMTCEPHIKQAVIDREEDNAYFTTVITGVPAKEATYEDFQRLFKCENISKADCNDNGLQFPRSCSHPPCNQCTVDYNSK